MLYLFKSIVCVNILKIILEVILASIWYLDYANRPCIINLKNLMIEKSQKELYMKLTLCIILLCSIELIFGNLLNINRALIEFGFYELIGGLVAVILLISKKQVIDKEITIRENLETSLEN